MQSYADYLMVITPPDAVAKEISRYKRASVNMIGQFEGMHSPAQLVVSHQTRCKPFFVQPAIEQMAKRLSTMPPVELQVSGFGFFDNSYTSKTIYAVIERNTRTDNWFKLLHNQAHIKAKNFMPQIIIAKNIPVAAFNKLWPNFKDRPFSAKFRADSLTILHRDTYVEYCEWRVYKELFFSNRLKEMF
jgi:hypothetical protein